MPQMESAVRTGLALGTALGEGLHWDTRRSVLWMVDITRNRLMCWDLKGIHWQEWVAPQRIGWVLPFAHGNDVLLGLQGGFGRARLDDPIRVEWLARPFTSPALRLNDAKADATGAVWAGSLNHDDESRSDGCLFRLGTDGKLTTHDTGYMVANGPAISPDGRWMLHSDSGRRTIYRFSLDAASARLAEKTVWKVFSPDEGFPDGMNFDAEGCVWVAHWGAGCVSRFAPDGTLLRRVRLPATNVTNVCFAGAALDRLFVTSARAGLSMERLSSEPLAGSLFEVDPLGASGLPGLPFGGPGLGEAQ